VRMAQADEELSARRSVSRWRARAAAVERRAHKLASASGAAVVLFAPAEVPQRVGRLLLRPRATRQRARAVATARSLLESTIVGRSASRPRASLTLVLMLVSVLALMLVLAWVLAMVLMLLLVLVSARASVLASALLLVLLLSLAVVSVKKTGRGSRAESSAAGREPRSLAAEASLESHSARSCQET
jgi:ABC-type multidrug transport system fused ATPase/permease subunit